MKKKKAREKNNHDVVNLKIIRVHVFFLVNVSTPKGSCQLYIYMILPTDSYYE